ncbi:DEKNAAC100827 [Brettanomyces naardenensis]|uniref:DEKNAAC100827 n=1 Tax=Brettanomyces naardenensis TaxID=13370 RepID=A0A448YG55_BRENA|nr:DEKNAAC100827 [Brettanomyces naardenensis]
MKQLSFHGKVVVFQCTLLAIAFAFQLMAVLTVPVTGLTLCSYQGYRFGVFGLCDDSDCTSMQIGYRPIRVKTNLSGFTLPSNARHSISYLLVVHPISTAFTGVQLLITAPMISEKFSSSSAYLLVLLLWTLPTFILTLLSFLVDLLMFIPHLRWCGWTLLGSTCMIALCGTTLCIMRRTVTSRMTREYTKALSSNDIYLSAVNNSLDDSDESESRSTDRQLYDNNSDGGIRIAQGRRTTISQYSESYQDPDQSYEDSLEDRSSYVEIPLLQQPQRSTLTSAGHVQSAVHDRNLENPPTTLFVSDSESDDDLNDLRM